MYYIILWDELGRDSRELETVIATDSKEVWDIANAKYSTFEYFDVYGWFETEETLIAWKNEINLLPKI